MILFDASLRITVVAAIVALILTVMRVRTSGVRHAAWTVVLVAMLFMPVLPSIVPTFTVSVPAGTPLVPPGRSVLPDMSIEPVPPMLTQQDGTSVRAIPFAPVQFYATDGSIVGAESPWSIWSLMSASYAIGAILLLLRLIAGWCAVARLARRASPIAHACEAPVRESALLATPLTAGVLAPVIILPHGWTEWPAEKLQACLAHEFAHIQRRDALVAFIAHLNRCVFWFHPLAWWLERTLAVAAEDAADEAAVRAIGNRRRYAEVLLDIADAVRLHGGRVAWQGVGAGDRAARTTGRSRPARRCRR